MHYKGNAQEEKGTKKCHYVRNRSHKFGNFIIIVGLHNKMNKHVFETGS